MLLKYFTVLINILNNLLQNLLYYIIHASQIYYYYYFFYLWNIYLCETLLWALCTSYLFLYKTLLNYFTVVVLYFLSSKCIKFDTLISYMAINLSTVYSISISRKEFHGSGSQHWEEKMVYLFNFHGWATRNHRVNSTHL